MKLPYGTKKAIKQYLKERCSKHKAAHILRKTERIYTSFVREAPAPNIMNFLRCQYYGGLSVFAFYETMNGILPGPAFAFDAPSIVLYQLGHP